MKTQDQKAILTVARTIVIVFLGGMSLIGLSLAGLDIYTLSTKGLTVLGLVGVALCLAPTITLVACLFIFKKLGESVPTTTNDRLPATKSANTFVAKMNLFGLAAAIALLIAMSSSTIFSLYNHEPLTTKTIFEILMLGMLCLKTFFGWRRLQAQ